MKSPPRIGHWKSWHHWLDCGHSAPVKKIICTRCLWTATSRLNTKHAYPGAPTICGNWIPARSWPHCAPNSPQVDATHGTATVFCRPLTRSAEHTSELQSRGHLVCRLLLERKKT